MSGAEDTSVGATAWSAAGAPAAAATAPPRGRLFRKYALLFIGLVGAALLVNSAFDLWFSYQENKAALVRVQQEKAQAAASRIDEFIGEIERQIGWTTHAQWAAAPLDQRRQDYFRLLRQVPAITELSQLDADGKEQLKVSRLSMDVIGSGADFSQAPAFQEAKSHRVWFSPVYFRKESEPYMTLAIARDGRNAGVTVAEINLKLIWDVITAMKIGEQGYAYVVDGRGRLIAHPDISLVLRDTDLSTLPQVAAALPSKATPSPTVGEGRVRGPTVTVAKNFASRSVLTAHAAIQPLGWLVFVEVPLREAFAPLYGAAIRTLLLLAFGLVAATLAAVVLARRMTGPIRAIAAGAERLGAGELDRRIEVHTGDELEALAGQFNRMAGDLQKSYAELEQRVRDRTAELSEALDQQTATAEVLQVINASPGDLAPVFDAMLDKAINLCQAAFGTLWTYDGEHFQAVALHRVPQAFAEYLSRGNLPNEPGSVHERLSRGERVVQIEDVAAQPVIGPARRALVEGGGGRALIAVPLRKDDKLLGAITAYRQEVRPFSDKQIALLQNFAAQAVIAMENARLITETREALEQQTATAEVLGVINSSPGDLAPVFDAILEKAHSLCGIALGELELNEDGKFRAVAVRGVSGPFAELLRQPFAPPPNSPLARLLAGERIVEIADVSELARRRPDDQRAQAGAQHGLRTALFVPLRKDDALLGYITAYRREVRPFSEKEIALLQNFAAQAVIAMENARLITETREALEQQTATAEVLGVINSSPGDLAPVFDAMLEKALTLCEAVCGQLATFDGETFEFVALKGDVRWLERRPHGRLPPSRGLTWPRIVSGEPYVHILDAWDTEAYRSGQEGARDTVITGGRTYLTVALRKEQALLGALTVYRQEVRPFTDKQIALLQNFAAQAVIAIENARLITETREALEQQTATAEVLGVINSSPGDLAPVFDAILDKAHALCGATSGSLVVRDGDHFRAVATHGLPEQLAALLRQPFPTYSGGPQERLLHGERIIHIPDQAAKEQTHPIGHASVEAGDRTLLFIPLRKDGTLLGYITAAHKEVRPFTDKQIGLLQNFAAQAVIAMENARLITETREALEQQTATAEVLGVINSSPGDLAPVFDAILEKAHTLCGADHGALVAYDGEHFRAVATHGVPEQFEAVIRTPFRAHPGNPVAALVRGERLVHLPDMAEIAAHAAPDNAMPRAALGLGGVRTFLAMPLRKDDNTLLGFIAAYRQEVRPFSDKQIALLQNFAAQAVIAMENARLITETREALEQQTATAEVLGVINSSPGDLAPVFDAILEKAHALCGAAHGGLLIRDGNAFRIAAVHGDEAFATAWQEMGPLRPPPGSPLERVLGGERVVQVADALGDEFLYRDAPPPLRRLQEIGNIRTLLIVPLAGDDRLLGAITAFRQEVRPFTDKQVALLQNFAAQAVIAMENARLITETREALEQQTATAEVLGVINASPGDLAPVFDAMLDKAMRLCGAAFGMMLVNDEKQIRTVGARGVPAAFEEFRRCNPIPPGQGGIAARIRSGEPLVHIVDLKDDDLYRNGDPQRRALVDLAGARTSLVMALTKDREVLGAIHIYRTEVRPFSDKQIALLQNFAAQAVIAMENARLITETREALEQQTATAEVLGVINSSPGDLAPVFDAMLEKAMRLCEAAFGTLWTYDGACVHAAALHNVPPVFAEFLTRAPHQVGADSAHGRLLRGEEAVHIPDIVAEKAYRLGDPIRRALVELGGGRTLLAVPLRKDNIFLGDFVIYRREARPFTDKQIALLQNFAAQAVIAMENARLITETREALDQQTATAEVLGVINSSPGDLAPVFDAMLEKAMRLCTAAFGYLEIYDGETFSPVASRGLPARYAEYLPRRDRPEASSSYAQIVGGAPFVHVADLMEGDAYRSSPLRKALVDLGGARTSILVALRRDEVLLGSLVIYRQEVRAFTDKQIALLQNFAAQAVIAMENARLITETREALEQQTATAEVLGVINSSPGDLAPVFDAMLEKAMRLCEAAYGVLWTSDGEAFRTAALRGVPPDYAEFAASRTRKAEPHTALGELADGARFVHIADVASRETTDEIVRQLVELGSVRTLLAVPLRKDGALLGSIHIYRTEVRPFTDKQIALLQNFAAQAVIAMENARLITETREALEQQTATAEVLGVINSSPGDLAPVFEAILDKAHTLCDVAYGSLELYDGTNFRAVASIGYSDAFADLVARGYSAAESPDTRALIEGERFAHILDLAETDSLMTRTAAELEGHRTLLCVPLRRENQLLGMIASARKEVRPFSEKEIALLENFAAQAVIAMENARLITETRERTRDLQESLEYQTAVSDVLQVISRSTFDLQPVLDTLVGTAARLCDAEFGALSTREADIYRVRASFAIVPEFDRYLRARTFTPGRDTITGRTALERRVVQIADSTTDPEFAVTEAVTVGKLRTMLGVPLLREGEPIGVLVLSRQRVEPFTERQIELVRTFADQAVIAIENARLLGELRERTDELGRSVEELKALSEVGQAVSSTLEVRDVLATILDRSVTLAGADAGVIFRYRRAERAFRFVEAVGYSEAQVRDVRALEVGENVTGMGLAVANRVPLQIPDLRERPPNPLRDQAIAAGYRSVLIVPLVGADRILGATILQRRVVGEFPEATVRLMQTLAAQSVLAIQNARLFREIADKSEELRLASQHKSQFLANMSHELRTPLNAILGYAELLADGIYGELPARAAGVLERVQNNGKHLLALINDVLDLAKIEAGQLALTLEDYALPDVVQSVVSATESLANTKGLKFTADVMPGLPLGHGDARRLSQVLLNLTGNAIKFTDAGEVAIGAAAEDGHFVLTVRDTGPGIAAADQGKIFEEFQQIDNSNTRKKGGTGLGLAISKRMVEMQGGTISVKSELGHGATFRVTLPIRVEEVPEELMGAA